MNNDEFRDLYQRTFSRVHSASAICWENYERKPSCPAVRSVPRRRGPALAAVLVLLFCTTAFAAQIPGLRDLLLRQPTASQSADSQTISLSGYMDTPESRALAEWTAFKETRPAEPAAEHPMGYECYMVDSPESAAKLEEITEKYDLQLHSAFFDGIRHPELTEQIGDFLGDASGSISYMYEDGTFHVDSGRMELTGLGTVEFQLQRAVRGTFHEFLFHIGSIDAYTQWAYFIAEDVPVTLALGHDRAWILYDAEDCFITVLILSGTDAGFTAPHLEEMADRLDLSVLSPVVPPQPAAEPQTGQTAGERTDAAKTYAAVLRGLFHDHVLPDGRIADANGEFRFAVTDVNEDGRDELVLCDETNTENWVLGFDDTYTGSGLPITVQADAASNVTFYSDGYMIAENDDSAGYAGDVLSPYTLYRFNGSLYDEIADVDAWDAERFPDAFAPDSPAAQKAAEGGAAYFITYTYASDRTEADRFLILAPAEYDAWRNGLNLDDVSKLRYLPVTDENIAALTER